MSRYLVALCLYIHSAFIAIYFEEGTYNYSPFDDINKPVNTPTIELALEELVEAAIYTVLGVTYLTFVQLKIKSVHHEVHLLKEAKRRLQKYFVLTHTRDHSSISQDITELVDRTKKEVRGVYR